MNKELLITLAMIFSWAAATLFTSGINEVLNINFKNRHHKYIIYFLLSGIFIYFVIFFNSHIKHK